MLGGERTGGDKRASGTFLGSPVQERDCDSTHTLRFGLRKLSAQGRACGTEEGPLGLRSSRGQDSQGLKAEPKQGKGLGREEGDSHEDVERPPEDRMSEEACEPHPEDVWDLEGHKGTVGWGSGWILGGQTAPPQTLPTPHLEHQDDHGSNDSHQFPPQSDAILGGHVSLL